MSDLWLKCSACRRDIAFKALHWICSVSTCNRSRTRLVFCSVACWDSHVAMLRHRDAWAVEACAPSAELWARELAAAEVVAASAPPSSSPRFAAKPVTIPERLSGAPSDDAAAAVRRRLIAEAVPSSARIAPPAPNLGQAQPQAFAEAEREMLIVVSKLKKYVKERSGMNCSDAVAEELSDHVRALCDEAIRAAGTDERKTVLDRDVPRLRRP